MKICKKCKQEKPLTEFHKDSSHKDGLRLDCKECRKPVVAAYYRRNSLRIKQRNLTQAQRRRANTLRYAYGINTENYEQLFIKQNGKCAICGKPEERKGSAYLCVDHCHKTGKVRGLLCHKCNSGIGKLNDDVTLLKNAISYLEYSW